ncbi:MAG: pyridine nucleotide-disulfide oxidoreductase, partial [Oscillospiraceae bacterium]
MPNAKVLAFANRINRTENGKKGALTYDDPEYKLLEPVITDEMADVGIHLEFRHPLSAEEVAARCGKPVDETKRILEELVKEGGSFYEKQSGIDKYWVDVWVPGHMELVVNHYDKSKVENFKQIAEAFEVYGRKKAPAGAGVFPIGTGPMRVIPIESAIQGETKRASYEEVSKYLNENT